MGDALAERAHVMVHQHPQVAMKPFAEGGLHQEWLTRRHERQVRQGLRLQLPPVSLSVAELMRDDVGLKDFQVRKTATSPDSGSHAPMAKGKIRTATEKFRTSVLVSTCCPVIE